MAGVAERCEGLPVELWRSDNGRLMVRAYNECGNNHTDVDLWNLIDWLQRGSNPDGLARIASMDDAQTDAADSNADRQCPGGN
jgi:hypothetical protein